MHAAALLARLSPVAQVLWLRQQPPDVLLTVHRRHGYGAADCDCRPVWPPCPEHTLTRFQLIARALAAEERRAAWLGKPAPRLGDLGRLDDGKLFARAFPEFHGADRCDCPTILEPCEHSRAFASTPLSFDAMDELLLLLAALGLADPPEEPPPPPRASRCMSTATKSVAMAARLPAGFGLYHQADRLQRDRTSPDFLQQIARRLRNGALGPAEVGLREQPA